MGEAVELIADRSVDHRMAMAVEIRPDRAVAVEVTGAFGIEEIGSRTRDDHERIDLRGAPIPHLREGVPEVLVIEAAEIAGSQGREERGHRG